METLDKRLAEHLEENKKEFARIQELREIDGENFSHFRKDMTDIKGMLIEQNRTFKTHTERVEPMLLSYEENKIASKVIKRYAKSAVAIGGVIGAYYIMKDFLVSFILKH